MSSMHSLIWFYDIEALTVFQLAQMGGAEGQGQLGAQNLAQDYLQQWLLIVAILLGITVVLGLYGLLHHRFSLPNLRPVAFNVVTIVAMVIALGVLLEAEPRFLESTVTSVRQVLVRDLSDELRRSSDDLSRMARQYAVTGDAVWREYFDEILAIRNGEAPRPPGYGRVPWWDLVITTGERAGESGDPVALASLIDNSGLQPERVALLQDALQEADSLAALEQEALALVDSQVEAGGEYALAGDALAAMDLLHSPGYHEARTSLTATLAEVNSGSGQADSSVGMSLIQAHGSRLQLLQVAIVAMILAILANIGANYGGRARQRMNQTRIRKLEAELEALK